MRDLVAGERVDVARHLELELLPPGSAAGWVLIALDATGKTCTTSPPLDAGGRELRPSGSFLEDGRLALSLDRAPGTVQRYVLAAFDPAGGPMRRMVAIRSNDVGFTIDLRDRDDAAVILVETYRHRDGWHLAANGQGFRAGLPALAAVYGIEGDWALRLTAEHATPPSGTPPAPPATPPEAASQSMRITS